MPQYQGIFRRPQQRTAIRNGQWVTDPFFNNTTLLIQAQDSLQNTANRNIRDSSSSNIPITASGYSGCGTFNPYGQGIGRWSNYFDSSRIAFPYSINNDVSSGNFTIEFWVNAPAQSTSSARVISYFNGSPSFGTDIGWDFIFGNAGAITFEFYNGNTGVSLAASNALNSTWNHIAVVRNSNSLAIYLNGISQATATAAFTANTNAAWATYVGSVAANNTTVCNNVYISNLRITKGGALYTSNFTPSTVPLTTTVSTGTVSMLTCQANRFIDNGTYSLAASINSGTPSVQPSSPFQLQYAANDSANVAGSLYGGDSYAIGWYQGITGAATAFSNNNFTIECMVYLTASPPVAYSTILEIGSASAGNIIRLAANINSTGYGFFIPNSTSTGDLSANGSGTLPVNAWNHLAIIRNGGTTSLYLNGAVVASLSSTFTFSNSGGGVAGAGYFYIGNDSYSSTGEYFYGYISQVRITKGQALATGAFTPPTSPVTTTAVGWTGANAASSLTGTVSVLLNAAAYNIYDSTSKNVLRAFGNCVVSSAVTKNGAPSIYFDGLYSYIVTSNIVSQSVSSNNLTWEMFINTTQTGQYATLYSKYPSAFAAGMWSLMINQASVGAGDVALYLGDVSGATPLLLTTGVNVIDGNWHHIAVVRNGSSWVLYVDGVSRATATNSVTISALSANSLIGSDQANGRYYVGYMCDFRTSNVARYTSAFTPPTTALPHQ